MTGTHRGGAVERLHRHVGRDRTRPGATIGSRARPRIVVVATGRTLDLSNDELVGLGAWLAAGAIVAAMALVMIGVTAALLTTGIVGAAPIGGLVTLHRPSNVDDPERLRSLLDAIGECARQLPLLLPAHPRTLRALRRLRLPEGLHILPPQGYLDFLSLMTFSQLVITDSGGVQEETTYLGVPCLTLRDSTERPITVTLGTNLLLGANPERLPARVTAVLQGRHKRGSRPALWDGRAAERVADILARG